MKDQKKLDSKSFQDEPKGVQEIRKNVGKQDEIIGQPKLMDKMKQGIKSFQKIFQTKDQSPKQKQEMMDRYKASMILSAVGDAMGYKNGEWQFQTSGQIVHQKMMQQTKNKGIKQLKIDLKWRYSDDTVMHLATADALIAEQKNLQNINRVAQSIAVQYKKCAQRMSGRAPGKTCMKSISILNINGDNWNKIPYRERSVGCGGSMRSACIGLVYCRPEHVYDLIKVSIQAGRITHHNPVGYLGSVVSAYFTSLAVRDIKPSLWMAYFLTEAVPLCEKYIKQGNRQVDQNLKSKYWKQFIDSCINYVKKRNLSMQIGKDQQAKFPEEYSVLDRQHFYKEIAFGSWPGATGIDSVLIAYDALLGCEQFEQPHRKWEQFCLRGILHGGDNDSTGAIGGAWFGALHGFKGVPSNNYKQVQDNNKLKQRGLKLYKLYQHNL